MPPAHVLYAFEAAARHGNFSRAAKELNVSQPAISKAIGNFEAAISKQLFARSGPKVRLTASGVALSSILTEAFDSLETLISSWERRKDHREAVLLSISSSMAAHWLIPRLPDFNRAFPDVDLRFELIQGGVGTSAVTADLGLRRFPAAQALLNETFYMEEYIQPIASFDYLSRVGTFDRPRTGKSHTLIALSDHWCDWETFARLARIDMPRNYQLMVFSDYAVALQAALNGQGIALGWLSVASRLLASRSLQAASSAYINTGATYNFLSPNENSLSPVVASVRKWMIVQSEPDLDKIRKDARLHSMPHKIALPGARGA
ncbi:LysR family transcriptional regulator (plasmid) [Bosea vestrisii]|uniref:LysR family transcriptional regulator n=1 Tax=Bosea vestrisii TaxID=151416 RepID=UPI0024DFBED4|nr:LysR family transcriptional regulator [Bosea vestrisii]WID99933.1 LysR family transcriptional regulator [Bosea vestrisii]